ncbi:(S)-ureidoglycine aminohydrolase, partial [Mucuna pruriens]
MRSGYSLYNDDEIKKNFDDKVTITKEEPEEDSPKQDDPSTPALAYEPHFPIYLNIHPNPPRLPSSTFLYHPSNKRFPQEFDVWIYQPPKNKYNHSHLPFTQTYNQLEYIHTSSLTSEENAIGTMHQGHAPRYHLLIDTTTGLLVDRLSHSLSLPRGSQGSLVHNLSQVFKFSYMGHYASHKSLSFLRGGHWSTASHKFSMVLRICRRRMDELFIAMACATALDSSVVTLTNDAGVSQLLKVDSYAYFPPNFERSIESDASATIVVFERRYALLPNHVPEPLPLLETPGEIFGLRKLLPTSFA